MVVGGCWVGGEGGEVDGVAVFFCFVRGGEVEDVDGESLFVLAHGAEDEGACFFECGFVVSGGFGG